MGCKQVGAAIEGQLKDVDRQFLKSDPKNPRWINTAQWARQTMVDDGLLRNNSPRGIWEVAEAGVKYLQTHTGDS